jgi:hypothetical protein
LLAIGSIERFGVEGLEKRRVVLIAEPRECRCFVSPYPSERNIGASLRKPRLPGDHVTVLFQQRNGPTILNRMCPDRRATALHRWFETSAKLNLPSSKKIGQFLGLRVHRAAAKYRPSAGTALCNRKREPEMNSPSPGDKICCEYISCPSILTRQ